MQGLYSKLLCLSSPHLSKRLFSNALHAKRVLITGCKGQIGIPLTRAIVAEVGRDNVIATDLSDKKVDIPCRYETLDICDARKYEQLVKENRVDYIVHLAAILSALGERFPDKAEKVNVNGFLNALNIAREHKCKMFSPSSIAAYGGELFPKDNTPEDTINQPQTIYGITKVFNEMMGDYYCRKFGVDFRGIRYPGVISSEKYEFNGTACYST